MWHINKYYILKGLLSMKNRPIHFTCEDGNQVGGCLREGQSGQRGLTGKDHEKTF